MELRTVAHLRRFAAESHWNTIQTSVIFAIPGGPRRGRKGLRGVKI
jgi:hypothetical protein